MDKLKKIREGFGKRLLKLRIAKGKEQKEFGDPVGVSQRYINMLEKDQRKPSQALLIAFAVKYDFSENYLRTGRYSPWENDTDKAKA